MPAQLTRTTKLDLRLSPEAKRTLHAAAQATKQSLNEIAAGRYDEAAMREREALAVRSADFAEGRAAFAERREPRFTGR